MRTRPALTAAAALAASCALAPHAPAASPAPPTSHTIRNVTVIDVEAGRALPARTVVIEDGMISRITDTAPAPGPATESVIDGTGLYLIPGLLDAHVHYASPETYGPLFIAHGVTFVREMANDTATITALRDKLNSGAELGPEMVCTGAIIDGRPAVWPMSEECTNADEARAAVRKLKAAGVDMIKVYSKLPADAYRAAVEEAHAQGLKAVGHVPESVNLDVAMEVHQDSAEHLMGFEKIIARLVPQAPSEEEKRAGIWAGMYAWNRLPRADTAALGAELKKVATSGMMQCPTLIVMAGIGSIAGGNPDADGRMAYVPHELRAFWQGEMYAGGFARVTRENLPHMKTLVGMLYKAGAPMMVGTDLANPYVFAGSSVHDEMRLFAECGVPAADVLRDATIVPAKFCAVDNRLGSVAPGKSASLVLLKANPLDDITNTTKVAGVFLRGRYFDRAALDALLTSVRDAVAAKAPLKTKVALDLPGEVVARGTYTLKFGPYDAGTEDFLITRDPSGYHLMAHTQPKGGVQKPFVIRAEYSPDAVFRTATFTEQVKSPLEATYTLEDGTVTARARQDGADQPEQTMQAGPGAVMTLPVYCADLLNIRAAPLKPGESKPFTSLIFGYPTWRVVSSPATLAREEDTTLKRPSGAEVKVHLHTSTTTTPVGTFRQQYWTDENGAVLKSVMTMPFGTLTAELKQ